MECLLADVTLVCLLTRMREAMVFIVAFLVEALATKFANERFVPHVDSHVRVQSRAPVKCLPAVLAFVRFFRGMDYLVSAQRRRLTEPFVTNFADKGSGT